MLSEKKMMSVGTIGAICLYQEKLELVFKYILIIYFVAVSNILKLSTERPWIQYGSPTILSISVIVSLI